MIFNFTKTKQFSTRLSIKNKVIEEVKEIKLLGTYITNNLKWNRNTKFLVKKAYSRMEILRQLKNFTKSKSDMLQIYKVYIRSVVEQSCTVWSSSLAKHNIRELERVQKVATRIILGNNNSYEERLEELNLPTLKERRNDLSLKFANKCLKQEKTKHIFQRNSKIHKMTLRKKDTFKVKNARTERLRKSSILHMTRQLNKQEDNKRRIFEKYTQS